MLVHKWLWRSKLSPRILSTLSQMNASLLFFSSGISLKVNPERICNLIGMILHNQWAFLLLPIVSMLFSLRKYSRSSHRYTFCIAIIICQFFFSWLAEFISRKSERKKIEGEREREFLFDLVCKQKILLIRWKKSR